MNNYYVMQLTQEDRRRRTEAGFITAGFIAFVLLCMFLVKWKIPVFVESITDQGIEVELNLPDEPETLANADGGGGGGNPVQAVGEAGIAKHVPQPAGEPEASNARTDITDDNKEAPALPKNAIVKQDAKKRLLHQL